MIVIKVAKKNIRTLIPRLKENTGLSRLGATGLPCSPIGASVAISSDLILARVEGLRAVEFGGTLSLISSASTGASARLPSSTF